MIKRRVNTALLAVAALLAAALSASATPLAAAQAEPVVFVHGYAGHGSNFNTIINRMQASGYPASKLYTFNYNSILSSDMASARELAGFVAHVRRANGNAQVAIVAHSNGGLVARSFIVSAAGQAATRRFVSLGSPHEGTMSAFACASPACYDMRAGSPLLTSLAGRGCDRSLWSAADGVVQPASSALCGISIEVAPVDHLALLTDENVYKSLRAALR
jgi:triacylglycerol lipase